MPSPNSQSWKQARTLSLSISHARGAVIGRVLSRTCGVKSQSMPLGPPRGERNRAFNKSKVVDETLRGRSFVQVRGVTGSVQSTAEALARRPPIIHGRHARSGTRRCGGNGWQPSSWGNWASGPLFRSC
jgi:hypothetical protein